MPVTDEQPGFIIFNASAGSGKTYSLVKAYLLRILANPQPDAYRHLLAITFTNKAVAEMKGRIIHSLLALTQNGRGEHQNDLKTALRTELDLTEDQLAGRAQTILNDILHNYSGFSVETIDGFNHRLIRTFARDLKIASNFEVSLDLDDLLNRAVDRLIDMAGREREITDLLVEFSLRKADDDRSWDIAKDILDISARMFSENDRRYIDSLKDKSLLDFNIFSKQLREKLTSCREDLGRVVAVVFETLQKNGIPENAFNRSSYPKFFRKLEAGQTDVSFNAQWQLGIRDSKLYSKAFAEKEPDTASLLDDLQEELASYLDKSKQIILTIGMLENILENLTPLSVINMVRQQVEALCLEENLLPIADFNKRIHEEIKDEPVPYIYERLGDRYRHFFIDEFQDTSVLQWQNLIPLIDNALSQLYESGQAGSLLLVGDAKQSIYRWRGGVPEQFIDLYQCYNPFSASTKEMIPLEHNWRSFNKIVEFNNAFFTYVARQFLNDGHKDLYIDGNRQLPKKQKGGYVQISFIESLNKEQALLEYGNKVVQLIAELLKQGYKHSDICILTRKTKQSVLLGETLLEAGFPVISSETLLLSSSPLVCFLENVLQYSSGCGQEMTDAAMLTFLHRELGHDQDLHSFLQESKQEDKVSFERGLKTLRTIFNPRQLLGMSLYEGCVYTIDSLDLHHLVDARAEGFLNLLLDFGRTRNPGNSFLEYWDSKKDTGTINIASGLDAINLMTIHKAKGLEFRVVIFPFADENLYREIRPKAWMDISGLSNDFSDFLVNMNKGFEDYSPQTETITAQRRETNQLDNINLLYVACTRAIERLYVLSLLPGEKAIDKPNSFNTLLAGYLVDIGQWTGHPKDYTFGQPVTPVLADKSDTSELMSAPYRTSSLRKLSLNVAGLDADRWFARQDRVIKIGNELHELMSRIRTPQDAKPTFEAYLGDQANSTKQRIVKMAKNIVKSQEMQWYFEDVVRVENEREMLSNEGQVLRPDRIHYNRDGTVTVIDYKTGGQNPSYHAQMERYRQTLESIGFTVRECLLIYVSTKEVLINKL